MNSGLTEDARRLLSQLEFDSICKRKKQKQDDLFRKYSCFPDVGFPAKIMVGTGSCGLSVGAGETFRTVCRLAAQHDLNAEITETGCIGLCSEEPIITVTLPGRACLVFGHVESDFVEDILLPLFQQGKICREHLIGQLSVPEFPVKMWEDCPLLSEHPFYKGQTRKILKRCGLFDPLSLDSFLALGGYAAFSKAIHTMTPEEVLREIELSGLRGVGGSGFPVAEKWRIAAETAADRKYLICNANEGDPGAYACRCLMEGMPHLVLEGLAIAAYAIGVSKAFICIQSEYKQLDRVLKNALKQSEAYGLTGANILDSGFDFSVEICYGAGAYICGEETALINHLEGKRGTPVPRPPYPAKSGLHGCPTVINNIETLANVPGIILDGYQAYQTIGKPGEYGTKIVTLSGKLKRRGTVEIPFGTPLDQVINGIAGGPRFNKPLKMLQIGGPGGGFLPARKFGMPLLRKEAENQDVFIGSGGIIAFDENDCIVDALRYCMDFLRHENCGKCFPCREGTESLWHILDNMTHGRSGEKKGEAIVRFQGALVLYRVAKLMQTASLCGLGKSAARPVLSAIRWFQDELDMHLFDRYCPAGVCEKLMGDSIEPEKCINCKECRKNGHSDAIGVR